MKQFFNNENRKDEFQARDPRYSCKSLQKDEEIHLGKLKTEATGTVE